MGSISIKSRVTSLGMTPSGTPETNVIESPMAAFAIRPHIDPVHNWERCAITIKNKTSYDTTYIFLF
jgi:hypothetical protein